MAYVAEQRHAHIIEQLEKRQVISIRDLCQSLDVTRETVRRDLALLASRNLVRQVRGGAAQVEPNEPSLADRSTTNPLGKQAMGRTAAALIPDGASVILDSGSTTQAVATALSSHNDLTVYTNDIVIALQLRETAQSVHLLGGEITRTEDSTRGLDAIDMVSRYRVDYALIGVGGLSVDGLFTDFSRDAAALRSSMIACAATSILLVDHTKFGKVASVQLRNANKATQVISDQMPDKPIMTVLKDHDLELIVAA